MSNSPIAARKRWTKAEDEVLLHAIGQSWRVLSLALGRTEGSLKRRALRLRRAYVVPAGHSI